MGDMFLVRKWRKNLVELDARLEESNPARKREVTSDSINIDELLPKFIENMRRQNEQVECIEEEDEKVEQEKEEEAEVLQMDHVKVSSSNQSRNEIEMLAKLNTGIDPNNNPFCTYSAYNAFFGIKPPQSIPDDQQDEQKDASEDEYD